MRKMCKMRKRMNKTKVVNLLVAVLTVAVLSMIVCSYRVANQNSFRLFQALMQDNSTDVMKILREPVNPNYKDEVSEVEHTLLDIACEDGNYEIIEKLLNLGANPNVLGPDGLAALTHALYAKRKTEAESIRIAKLLISHGATVRALGRFDFPPLTAAIRADRIETAKLLIQHGAQVNSAFFRSDPPLTEAVGTKDYKMVELLLASGADPFERNKDNTLPIDNARSLGDMRSVDILKDAMAKRKATAPSASGATTK